MKSNLLKRSVFAIIFTLSCTSLVVANIPIEKQVSHLEKKLVSVEETCLAERLRNEVTTLNAILDDFIFVSRSSQSTRPEFYVEKLQEGIVTFKECIVDPLECCVQECHDATKKQTLNKLRATVLKIYADMQTAYNVLHKYLQTNQGGSRTNIMNIFGLGKQLAPLKYLLPAKANQLNDIQLGSRLAERFAIQ